ncbi:hypothetical protein M426DRAFT_319633 [Hypoxylon sp. CI-4A]|nr:hypothetical protein M426DRAFT_319633 [Hypoxylon sp. CI-4A]
MPKPRSYCSIESPTHGNMLWVALDHGATRIGYAFTDDRAKSYTTFDEAAAIKEAITAVKPFDIEFERVDWWTIYTVGQKIAKNFSIDDCVFLAGDACHTHSSGAAQGMNTGLHDAVNLAWKLYLILRGARPPNLLQTYQAERRPNVERLIQYDKDISRLMTNRLPENWIGDPDADVNVVLGHVMADAGAFTSGLDISYEIQESNPLNVDGSFRSSRPTIKPGRRGPDITLLRPGTFEPTRLIRELPNTAAFGILIFATVNKPAIPDSTYRSIAGELFLEALVQSGRLKFITIFPNRAPSPYELLGYKPLGRAYFDNEAREGYSRYGVDTEQGAIVVLRPDGWIGTMIMLGPRSGSELRSYFDNIFLVVP